MTVITSKWRIVMRTYNPEDMDAEDGYTYSYFDYESEHEAALALEAYEYMYSGYPVDFWIEEVITGGSCY